MVVGGNYCGMLNLPSVELVCTIARLWYLKAVMMGVELWARL
jgi:hypothetical protein